MHVISKKVLQEFWQGHADAEGPLMDWYDLARNAAWSSIADVRRVFTHADAVRVSSGRTATIFNIGGNKYRLITSIHYNRQKVYILRVYTHRQYDRENWNEQL
jgi:mRNA interferase HigB